jgi:hypothetical protein
MLMGDVFVLFRAWRESRAHIGRKMLTNSVSSAVIQRDWIQLKVAYSVPGFTLDPITSLLSYYSFTHNQIRNSLLGLRSLVLIIDRIRSIFSFPIHGHAIKSVHPVRRRAR